MVGSLLCLLVSQCAVEPAYPFPSHAVLGVRDDPLDAYADLAPALYPAGIPTSERGVALAILREARLQQAIGPASTPPSSLPEASLEALPAPTGIPPVPLELIPLSQSGTRTETVRLHLRIGAAASGSVTLVLVARERELIPAAGWRVLESRRQPREIARFSRTFSGGGGTFDLPLAELSDDLSDDAAAYVVVRVAGVGTARGFAGIVPLRSPGVDLAIDRAVLTSERSAPVFVTP